MRNLFTNHYYRIEDDPFTLYFFGDVHAGVESFAEDKFRAFVKDAAAIPNAYFIGMGDYLDFASFSGNKRLNSGDLHETEEEWINSRIKKDCDEFIEMLQPLKGRIIGMIGGNHQFSMSNGKTTDQYIAEKLETTYLGWLSVISISFGTLRVKGSNHCRIFACHRARGGRLLGSSINGVVDMANVINNCDIYAAGDDHKRHVNTRPVLQVKPANLSATGFTIKEKRQYFVRSGSFQRSYVKDTSGFAQSKLMYPVDLGAVRLDIESRRVTSGNEDHTMIHIEGRI